MNLNMVGINHQTAPVAIREKVAVSANELSDTLSLLSSYSSCGIILSTCNRTEIYTVDDEHNQNATLEFLKKRLDTADLSKYIYLHNGKVVVEHLFRVASGLESMIVGEFEVLGQVKQSFDAAEVAGMVNLPLRQIFNSAIRTGRRVREETGISKKAISVSSVAVDLAADIVKDLAKSKMVVIGAGEAGRLVAKVARERGTSQIFIANRTRERAQALAKELNGTPIAMNEMANVLLDTNIIVTCSAAPRRIVNSNHVNEAMRNRPALPLVIVDIGIPRNVEPEVGNIRNVFLYNIDNLIEISDRNHAEREGEIQHAERIIAEEVTRFDTWWQDFQVRPIITALMSKAEKIRLQQLDQTIKKLPPLSDEQRESLEAMTRSIVTRILKDPVQYLKTNSNGSQTDLIKELFRLNTES